MRLSLLTLLVPSYDEGLAFFVDGLGWICVANEDQGRKRWVVVAPNDGATAIVLALPSTDAQRAALGHQTGDRVGLFLESVDFANDASRIEAAGGVFIEPPRHEPYGTVAQWRDPWGNLWDLIEPIA